MLHATLQIRNAVRDRLAAAGLVDAGRVFVGRMDAVAGDEMPCLIVEAQNERIDAISNDGAPRLQARTLDVDVIAFARITARDGSPDPEADLSPLRCAVEAALADGEALAVPLMGWGYLGAEPAFSPGVETPHVGARMRFAATFHTREGAPSVIVDPES